MSSEVTMKVIIPEGVRFSAKDICTHMRALDQRIFVQLIFTMSGDGRGPTLEELRLLMEEHIKELRGE
jgi:hypothetical protein